MTSDYTFVFPTRGRPEDLKACVDSIFKNALDKKCFDIVVRIDDDDQETRELLDSGHFDGINIRYLTGERIGYDGLYRAWDEIYPMIGKSFIYYSDDHRMCVKGFDELLRKHLDHPCVFGHGARNGVTKLLMEENEYFRNYAGMRGKCDTLVWQTAKMMGLYEPSFELYKRTDGKILGRVP